MNWFRVDKEGLSKLLEQRGKAFAIFELLQNAWDQNVSRVSVKLNPIPNKPQAELIVEDDDPEGFSDLSHAYTLFAESEKKDDPEKRGRFNLGEKLVLSLCTFAKIVTTTGTVVFDENGRSKRRTRRDKGSCFSAHIRMTRAELEEAEAEIQRLIPPKGITTTFNGQSLSRKEPLEVLEESLRTEVADADGNLKRTTRKTEVHIYEPRKGEEAALYEMGIPVVETGDRYHVDVQQKVPLNMDRDNVTPAYLRKIRVLVLNAMHERLTEEDANSTWVQEASSHKDCDPEAVETFIEKRFGEDAVIHDPTDPEASNRAVAAGKPVIHGRNLSKSQWSNVKEKTKVRTAPSAGFGSPKFYSDKGKPENIVPEKKQTAGMKRVSAYAKKLARHLMDIRISVSFTNEMKLGFSALYGNGRLKFNIGRLGKRWFSMNKPTDELHDLLIHEFGHQYSTNHLSDKYHKALTKLGAKLTRLALKKPELFQFE